MKDSTIKSSGKLFQIAKNYYLKNLFAKIMYFISSLIISRGYILGNYYPFGISFSACVTGKMLIPTFFGSILGYLIPLRFGTSIRYISALLSLFIIKWALGDIPKIKKHILYKPALVFMSCIATGLAVNCTNGINIHGILVTLLECFIASLSTYFFSQSFEFVKNKKITKINLKDFICIVSSISICLIALSEISVHGISLGKILAVVIVLIFANSFKVAGGSIAGIILDTVFSLPVFGFDSILGCFSFSGLVAGGFSNFGKISCIISFVPAYIIACFRCNDPVKIVNCIYELFIGSALFLILPNKIFKYLKETSLNFCLESEEKHFNKSLLYKLKTFKKCFSSCADCLNSIELKVGGGSDFDFEEACFDSVKACCSSCEKRKICWDENCKLTYNNIKEIITKISINDFQENLSYLKECPQCENLIKRIKDIKKDYLSYNVLKPQAEEFKSSLQQYFGSMSFFISEILKNFCQENVFDEILEDKIRKILFENNIKVENIICKKNSNRLFIRIETGIFEKIKFNEKIINFISNETQKNFEKPSFIINSDNCTINIIEKKNYKVNFFVAQHACNGGKFCGDSCRCFESSEGNFNAILSDGMGTGSSAAMQGTLVSELAKQFLKFGINFPFIIKNINSALVLNKNSEMLATLDMISINLFDATANFIKAGSPATFIISKNKVKKVDFSSLPIGILSDTSFSYKTLNLNPEDIIIMLSDGVTDLGENWILDLLKNMNLENLQDISKYIVGKATGKRKYENDDDITAIAIKISKI